MIITANTIILLVVCFGIHRAEVCQDKRFNILQNKNNKAYLDPYKFRSWPKDSAGMQNADSICPRGYTCLPNYIEPPVDRPKKPTPPPPQVKNSKYRASAYAPTTPPGAGCLGLDEYDEVAMQSSQTQLYLGSCEECTGTAQTKPKNVAMVYTSFNSPDAKWKLIPVGKNCTIKNLASGMYLSVCKDCGPSTFNMPLAALFRETIDKNTNDEMWIVTRKINGTYVFKSASTGGYLGVCEKCFAQSSTISSPASVFTTSPDASFIAWSINIDAKTGKYS
ncbi:uncharacterized protein NEMAJ01_0852 [Nematocida major]|uniref:uncharacterized protein n=1 Tax=Nematocida major TaxID=1912982 RepID=UPI002008407E|nr:uncharacterized protein NEMAJ01_0852 [Nematocida major]KAH9385956.1 hypothetical protein NEMAJ01_0852 [Nematocida major]